MALYLSRMTIAADPSSKFPRLPFLDALRGLALVGMFVFHFVWDLAWFGFVPAAFPYSPGFMFFGHVVASTFLALAGASLVLAARGGLNRRAFWKRLATIAAAAAAVSAATYYLFPDSFIFFGILHCIAVASLVALAFLRAPLWLVTAVAAAVVALPFFYASSFFDPPWFWWTGLGEFEPRSNDWRAFFPWAGFALAGVALMRAALARGWTRRLALWRADNRAARALTWGGRHSLLVYLAHQPLFFGLVYVASVFSAPAEEANYLRSCETQCVIAGGDAPFCARACGCFAAKLKQENLWRQAMRGSLSPAENETFVALSRVCAREAEQ